MIKTILVILSILVAGLLIQTFRLTTQVERIVVIDVIEVFNSFQMKKELEGRVEVKLHLIEAEIDSLKGLQNVAYNQSDSINWYRLQDVVLSKEQELQSSYEVSNEKINQEVWKRLNPLIDEYAETEKLRIVIGANGMGSVLYNKEAVNRTKELIEYINRKYGNEK